ncbi:MAG TPA: cysteine desulfurase [Cyclobacteriaceae bacterium]|nr:cysteine desulfurase [Cyclobacteriaceae bacterium]HMV10756.1 cysteine desulfurase [Cyclobacteriaceae bacterium]HMV91282.1 cysteine desulfurase [Cyclobacteriaceae bacterium]HMX01662.1 cysteine desulfurase [Cyclobacteriaceae bacterium]HMX52270.1 cysteine desulfurase [Cyclobacteriaceae bacterium]
MSAAINTSLDIENIRKQFPVLHQKVNGRDLVYFDNAATNQKPEVVIRALVEYYSNYNANIHRGIHTLAEKATKAYEHTRHLVKEFIHADSEQEIVFVRGVTEAINLVAATYGKAFIREGDEIIISGLEHHSNIVPWQFVCQDRKAVLKVIPVKDNGELDIDHFKSLLSDRTKLVAVNHASNSLGTINPIKQIIDLAHANHAVVLIDGAQAGAHLPIDVKALKCDFYCLSSHKMFGPTGTGILYGKKNLLELMPPYQGGGEMIKSVSFEKTTYNDLPYKFEAGTPNIADVIAFGKAIEFITAIGKEAIAAHEHELLVYATEKIKSLPHVRVIGEAKEKVGVLSFSVDGIHPFDIGQMLDARGIAVRTGHHCTEPLMARFGVEGTVRASFSVYNTKQEVDQLIEGLDRIIKFMK